MNHKQRLIELFRERAVRFGDFTLASGRKSTYYVDKMQITLHGEGLRLACEGLLELVSDLDFTAVGGMTLGADPIVGGMLVIAAARGQALEGFIVRKESKGHGTGQFIEGPVGPAPRAIIIEDVVTTAGSALQAVERVQQLGCEVVCVVTIVDRLEGGAEALAARNLPYRSLLSISDLGITPPPAV